jgi:hypothetical protein
LCAREDTGNAAACFAQTSLEAVEPAFALRHRGWRRGR